ncbi:M28 family peptidase [bacterium]|nr:M28 family peptidase [bacterium]
MRVFAIGLILIIQCASSARGGGFDAELAGRWIREQCAYGPRVPGTPAHENCRKWIGERLRELGMTVQEQEFATSLPLTRQAARACNIWGLPSKDGPTSPALIISAHWDTRPFADSDPSGTKPPMLGANDGAAAVAMALGLYKALGDSPLKKHIVLAFWDAEDAGMSGPDNEWTWAVGARYAAAHRPAWIKRVRLGINIDMPAGSDLSLKREMFSEKSAPWAVDEIWRIGHDLAPNRFSDEALSTTDDHRPWIDAGVPYVDLIGWPYAYWHTAGDTPEHCDPKAMRALGEVLDFFIRNGGWK